ncbi:carbon starvation protein [Thermoclostridium caenicola]|uniref:Carbon starvation protein n=2 Tax=Thermoclostridium caenicola TaxID=659425 RepID=A0A1M6CJH9_9FIRM|nr:carbon starvation protein [Thermoclostridium caenicola]
MAILLLILGLVLFIAAYVTYGAWLAKKWGIDPKRPTPAHTMRDGVDYDPTQPKVLLGHHFSSIAGAGPITGPILAAVFGWLPVYLWIILGSIFVGGVHDFSALFASVRHKSKSIGEIISANIGKRARILFNLFAWLTLILVVAAFTDICASTFAHNPQTPEVLNGARSGTISILFIVLAIIYGLITRKLNLSGITSVLMGIVGLVVFIGLGYYFPVLKFSQATWTYIMLVYIFAASVLPVWFLLQPRDYLCSFLLYAMLAGGVAGLFITNPSVNMPAFTSFMPANGSYLFPILFVTVACGAISGFHSLVSSGTTAKQVNNEKDMRLIGYGAMLIEGLVAVLALMAIACYGKPSENATPVQIFANGISSMINSFGVPKDFGMVFVVLAFSSFALTSLDTATRIARYMLQELADSVPSLKKVIGNKYAATIISILAAWGLLQYGYTKIWPIFGSVNQLLGALALIAVSVWLLRRKKNSLFTGIPAVFMVCVALSALIILMVQNLKAGNMVIGILSLIIALLAVALVVEAIVAISKLRKGKIEMLDDDTPEQAAG